MSRVFACAAIATLALSLPSSPAGSWRGVLDLAGATLPFMIEVSHQASGWAGRLCNGTQCQPLSAVRVRRDSVVLEMADYDAVIAARISGDSLAGTYRNVGNRGPRVIPFRAGRGRWPVSPAPAALLGRWD